MKMDCEKCGSKMLLKSKTKQKSGRTYYRFRCKNQQCLHRTTAYTGKITHPNRLATGGLKNASTKRALNEDQVLRVLLETRLGTTALARELGCNQRTVRDIKLGKAYKTFHVDVPRPGIATHGHVHGSCHDCIHWIDGHCSMDFPEAIRGSFAPLCSCYMQTQAEAVSDGIARSGSATKMETLLAEL